MYAKNQHDISTTLEIKVYLSEGTPSAEEENEERAYFKVQNNDDIQAKVINIIFKLFRHLKF